MAINNRLSKFVQAEVKKHYKQHIDPPSSIWWLNLIVALYRETGEIIKNDSELAKTLTLSRAAISNYRRGQSLSPAVAWKVASILEVNPLQVMSSTQFEQAKTKMDRAVWQTAWWQAREWRHMSEDEPERIEASKDYQYFVDWIEKVKQKNHNPDSLTEQEIKAIETQSAAILLSRPTLGHPDIKKQLDPLPKEERQKPFDATE